MGRLSLDRPLLPHLGVEVDAELDGQPDAAARGDDFNGVPDDEDGIDFTSHLVPGMLATVDVTVTGQGLLQGWMDFNLDGDWDEPDEQIFTNAPVSS